MSAASFLLVLGGVLLNAAGQLLLKLGALQGGPLEIDLRSLPGLAAALLSGWTLAGLACYAFSVLLWIVALSRVEVSVAYPMLSIGYVVNALAAWALLGEALTPLRWAAMAVIVCGVGLLAASARTA